MGWRALLAGAVLVVLLATSGPTSSAGPGAAARPLLKNACKLVTDGEIRDLMGRRPIRKNGYPQGCVWTTRAAVYRGDRGRRAEDAAVTLSGYRSAAEANEFLDAGVNGSGCDVERALPDRGLGDEAYLVCSNVEFRLGRFVGMVATFTNDVRESGRVDVRRTFALTRKAVKRLRGYRCGPPLCFR